MPLLLSPNSMIGAGPTLESISLIAQLDSTFLMEAPPARTWDPLLS
jgi:hypothetical protein